MTNKVALIGAGGKMGMRLARNLAGSTYDVSHIEISTEGRDKLKSELGHHCVSLDDGIRDASYVVMAVPDNRIGPVLSGFVSQLRPAAAVIMLDAAAPHAQMLPNRDDVTYFITHPCHPPLFGDEISPEARSDYFGGLHAKQHIVCALMHGPEEDYARCENLARTIFAPVMRSHRCSVEALAILEPALSETVGATLSLALKEATDEAIRRGVPEEAARDFMLGHLNIELAIAFGAFPGGRFSDGALKAIDEARPQIFREGWLERIFADEAVLASVRSICTPARTA